MLFNKLEEKNDNFAKNFTKVLTNEQIELLEGKLASVLLSLKHTFALVGGTAVSISLGHRQSIDFDFFHFLDKSNYSEKEVMDDLQIKLMKNKFYLADGSNVSNQWETFMGKVKITFLLFYNKYADNKEEKWGCPLFEIKKMKNGVNVLDLRDIAGMKAYARCERSKMKDIVDIGALIEANVLNLTEIISIAKSQFGYDFSEKEFLLRCLNIDDILEKTNDEPVIYLNGKNNEHYINIVKNAAKKYEK